MSETASVPADGGQGATGTPAPADPNATPATPNPANPNPAPEPEKPWYHGFKSPELRGYAEVKGWKDNEVVVESYRNLEKLHGVPLDRLLKLPESLDDAEAMKPILNKLGFAPPATADEYGFTTLEGADADFAQAAQGWMHKIGVPAKMAQAIAAEQVKYANDRAAREEAQAAEEVAIEMGQLQAELGAKFDAFLEKGRRAARMFGVDEDQMAALEKGVGAAGVMRFFANVGDRTGEAPFIDGGKPSKAFEMTPDGAKARISELSNNKEWSAKYLAGDKAAMAEMTRLQKMANPEPVS